VLIHRPLASIEETAAKA
jgi:SAM-dependent methyltransferase